MINESLPLKIESNAKKYQRSTTLVSQLSMGNAIAVPVFSQNQILIAAIFCSFSESGIIQDISSSPDNEVQTAEETATWAKSSVSFLQPHKTNPNASTMSQKLTALNVNVIHKIPTINNDEMNANATANPYINNDSIAVHL